jgi:hypothetical protein
VVGDGGDVSFVRTVGGDRLLLGDDAARQRYRQPCGGVSGLGLMLGPLASAMETLGLGAEARRQLFVDNPARAFAFAGRKEGP